MGAKLPNSSSNASTRVPLPGSFSEPASAFSGRVLEVLGGDLGSPLPVLYKTRKTKAKKAFKRDNGGEGSGGSVRLLRFCKPEAAAGMSQPLPRRRIIFSAAAAGGRERRKGSALPAEVLSPKAPVTCSPGRRGGRLHGCRIHEEREPERAGQERKSGRRGGERKNAKGGGESRRVNGKRRRRTAARESADCNPDNCSQSAARFFFFSPAPSSP